MKISIAELDDLCGHLADDETGITYWIQSYDGYCIEDDRGKEIILTFEDSSEKCITVTGYNTVEVKGYNFSIFKSVAVDIIGRLTSV